MSDPQVSEIGCPGDECRRDPASLGNPSPSISQVFLNEKASFSKFRRALRRSDQQALDDLFASAQKHLAPASYASHVLPMEIFLLAMLLEEHKEVMRLRSKIQELYKDN